MKKRGLIKKLAAGKAPTHPTRKEAFCPYHVEYQEDGKHVDSATFSTEEEAVEWLMRLYNIEATDGTV